MDEQIIKREMAARLARIEAAMSSLPDNIKHIKDRYASARNNLYNLRGMITTLKSLTEHDRNMLMMSVEIMQSSMYLLVDAICSLATLELAASDYAVLMCLLRDDLDKIVSSEGDNAETHVLVFDNPRVEGKAS